VAGGFHRVENLLLIGREQFADLSATRFDYRFELGVSGFPVGVAVADRIESFFICIEDRFHLSSLLLGQGELLGQPDEYPVAGSLAVHSRAFSWRR